jgi:tetratricopeptide (TPR) repeat protein
LGSDHEDTAATYNDIALVYDSMGNYDEALEWLFKSLKIKEHRLGREHEHTAISYNNIGCLYTLKSDYSEALKWHEKGLKVREKISVKEVRNPLTLAIISLLHICIKKIMMKRSNFLQEQSQIARRYTVRDTR